VELDALIAYRRAVGSSVPIAIPPATPLAHRCRKEGLRRIIPIQQTP
jgi:hypothetical protein